MPGLNATPDPEHRGALDRLPGVVEGLGDARDHVIGHAVVDLVRMLDELHAVAELLPGAPRQVGGVDRDAVAADAGARPEGLVAEGLRGSGVQRLPDVDAEVAGEHGELVDEGDVHLPVGVLDQLGHLGLPRRRRRDDRVDERRVERDRELTAPVGEPRHDLRGGVEPVVAVARIDPLGTVTEREVAPRLQPRRLQDRPEQLLGGARVGRRFEHHEHARRQEPRHVLGRGQHHREVGGAVGERGRQTQHDHVGVGEWRRRLAERGAVHRLDLRIRHVADVRPAIPQRVDLGVVAVDPDHTEAGRMHADQERQPDVAEPHHGGGRRAVADAYGEGVERVDLGSGHSSTWLPSLGDPR